MTYSIELMMNLSFYRKHIKMADMNGMILLQHFDCLMIALKTKAIMNTGPAK